MQTERFLPYKQFLGYDRGEDGKPVINPKEAKVVREIYRMFMEGKTPFAIGRHLERSHVPTPAGKTKWSDSTIISTLFFSFRKIREAIMKITVEMM